MPTYPWASALEPILAKRCTHTGEDPEILQTRTQSQAEQVIGQRKPEERPVQVIQTTWGCDSFSEPTQCLSTHTPFPPRTLYMFHYFCLFVDIHLHKTNKPGLCHCPEWSRGQDSALSLLWPDLSFGPGTEILLWAAAGGGPQDQTDSLYHSPEGVTPACGHEDTDTGDQVTWWRG